MHLKFRTKKEYQEHFAVSDKTASNMLDEEIEKGTVIKVEPWEKFIKLSFTWILEQYAEALEAEYARQLKEAKRTKARKAKEKVIKA